MPDIISIGECMVEFYAHEPLEQASLMHRSYGGDTLNLLVAASRLGSSTGYITRVGQDPFTSYLLASWQQEGIDISQVKLIPGFNGLYFISLVDEGQYQFAYYRKGSAASTLCPADLDSAYIASAQVLHVSGITQAISASSRRAVLAAVQMARQAGVLVSYDPNYRDALWSPGRARRALQEVLPFVDIFLPSAPHEIGLLLGTESSGEAVQRLWESGVRLVAIKEGAKGCTVGAEGRVISLEAHDAQVVDTTGAGDAFNGGFLHGLAQGLEPFRAARLALVTAGLKVQGRGAVQSLPTRAEVYRLLAEAQG
jgi:2-dehydro-3-deoxygluconokinase